MRGMKEKKRAPLEVVKSLAREKHATIYTIVQGNLEGRSDTSEYAVVTEEGLFFYKLYEGSLTPLTQVEWQNVQSGTVDFYAMKTVLTLNHHTFRLQDQGKNIHQYAQKRTGIDISVEERTWKKKIVGYRSSTPWKQTVAFFGYLFLATFLIAILSPLTFEGVTASLQT